MTIPRNHLPLHIGGRCYGLSHLDSFDVAIPGKGRQQGSDLYVQVVFSCHVYTKLATRGSEHHVLDHHGTRRTFDNERYEKSKTLQCLIKDEVLRNSPTFPYKDSNGSENLLLLHDQGDRTWVIVYCLRPKTFESSHVKGVRMEVLSFHPRQIDRSKISGHKFSFFARKCLFDGTRVPTQM